MKMTVLRFFLLFLTTAGLSSGSTQALPASDEWPMFRGNPSLNGLVSGEIDDNPQLLWTYETGDMVKSSAAIKAGKVYIGSYDEALHCIDFKTGKGLWKFPTEGPVESSPLVKWDRVYFGSGDGFLYAVDEKGEESWKYETYDQILGSPNWTEAGGKKQILIGGYDAFLHSLEASTGKTNWVYETGNYINGSPALDSGVTVFGG